MHQTSSCFYPQNSHLATPHPLEEPLLLYKQDIKKYLVRQLASAQITRRKISRPQTHQTQQSFRMKPTIKHKVFQSFAPQVHISSNNNLRIQALLSKNSIGKEKEEDLLASPFYKIQKKRHPRLPKRPTSRRTTESQAKHSIICSPSLFQNASLSSKMQQRQDGSERLPQCSGDSQSYLQIKTYFQHKYGLQDQRRRCRNKTQ